MDENPFPEAGFSKLFTEDESDSDSEQVDVQPAIIREGNQKKNNLPKNGSKKLNSQSLLVKYPPMELGC